MSLYDLNSRLNDRFPKPPYRLWPLDASQDEREPIGKTTLTGKIFLVNIAMFGLQMAAPAITARGAKRSDLILEGRQLYRLLTPVFLHGGVAHLAANCYSLKSMGWNVERAFGPRRLLATYLASGIAGNVLSALQSPEPAVGASGAIFGLVGAQYAFLSRNQNLFGRSARQQRNALLETIGMNVLLGATNPMIDNWGHLGGFIGGVGMAYLIGPKLYVARVPPGSQSGIEAFGAGNIVVDRPTMTLPTRASDGISWVGDYLGNLSESVTSSVRGLFDRSGPQEYYLDRDVNYDKSGLANSAGDGTIYRTLKVDDITSGRSSIEGSREGVPEPGPAAVKQRKQRSDRPTNRRKTPKAGYSIRPKYGRTGHTIRIRPNHGRLYR